MTRTEAVSLIASLILAAAVFQPILGHGRERADREECRRHIDAIITEAHNYGAKYGGMVPLGPLPHPPAYQSLQVLADAMTVLRPEQFVCPGSQRRAATTVSTQQHRSNANAPRFSLSPESSTYAWLGEYPEDPLRSAWISDDSIATTREPQSGGDNHMGGLNVGFGDRSVRWVKVEELPDGARLPTGLVDNEGTR